MRRKTCMALVVLAMLGGRAQAQTVALIADEHGNGVHLLDAESDLVVGSLAFPEEGSPRDCSVSPDRQVGYVTDSRSGVWVVNLALLPRLDDGTNRIPISISGQDTALTPDGRFLLVCGGREAEPVSVIDTALRQEVEVFPLEGGCSSVSLCDDGSVLVGSYFTAQVHRLRLDAAGQLTDTSEVLNLEHPLPRQPELPQDVACAPGSRSGVVLLDYENFATFTIPGLARVQTRTSGSGISVLFSPAGDRLYVQSNVGQGSVPPITGRVAAYPFDPALGTVGPVSFTTAAGLLRERVGVDQLGLHPTGSKLYAWLGSDARQETEPYSGPLRVVDAATGSHLRYLPVSGKGICMSTYAPELTVQIDFKPDDDGNAFNPRSGGRIPVALLSSPEFDATNVWEGAVFLHPGAVPSVHSKLEDVDRDGDLDLLLQFPSENAGLNCGQETAYLWGKDKDAVPFVGTDLVHVTGCR